MSEPGAGADADGAQPPAYSDAAMAPEKNEQESGAPPSYASTSFNRAVIPCATPATHLAKVNFPEVMKCFAYFRHLKHQILTGPTEQDQLFAVDVHTGYSGKLPLGTRVGRMLHAGPTLDTPVIGAVGEASDAGARPYAFILESIVMLPALPSSRKDFVTSDGFVTEKMCGHIAENGHVAFRFGLEVGREGEKHRREEFEWQRIEKQTDSDHHQQAPDGGFKLVQVPRKPRQDSVVAESSNSNGAVQESTVDVAARAKPEVLAILAFRAALRTWNHGWTLTRLVNSARAAELGQRWQLAVALTANRLQTLRTQGRIGRKHVKVGEKIHGKSVAT
jgi:hypothetical protein